MKASALSGAFSQCLLVILPLLELILDECQGSGNRPADRGKVTRLEAPGLRLEPLGCEHEKVPQPLRYYQILGVFTKKDAVHHARLPCHPVSLVGTAPQRFQPDDFGANCEHDTLPRQWERCSRRQPCAAGAAV